MRDEDCLRLRSTSPLLGVDMSQRIVCANEATARLLGRSEDQLVGRPCYEVLQGIDVFGNPYCGKNCPVHCARVRGDPVRPFELRVARQDGSRLRVQVHDLHVESEPINFVLLVPSAEPLEGALAEEHPPWVPAPVVASSPLVDPLTPRELEVLHQLSLGAGTRAIARALFIAPATVRNHVQHILQKLGVSSRLQAVAAARQRGLLSER